MRIIKSALVVLVAAAVLLPAAFARAEEEVKVEVISIDPVEISASEPVTLTFEISNHSDYELSGISIVQGGLVYSVAADTVIPPLGSAKIPLDVTVPDAQIGLPVKYVVSWFCAGEPFSKELEVTVGRAHEPTMTVTRTVSKTHARQGEDLTISYTLKNESSFDMTDIMLIDEEVSDDPICRNDTLRAKATYTFEHTYRMGSADVISAPVVTYAVNGKVKSFSAVEPVTISMILIEVRMEVQPGAPTAVGVPFIITVMNSGNQKISNISITDERGATLNDTPFSLEVGGTQAVTCNIVPVMTEALRNAAFTLNGVDTFGEAYSFTAKETYPVTPFVDESQIRVACSGTVTQEWTAQNGTVAVKLLINNTSAVTLTNAVLSETVSGVLMTYPTLANGQTILEQEIAIGSPRNLDFILKATDPAGTERAVATFQLTVAVPEETPVPEATANPSVTSATAGLFDNAVTRILIILGGILLLAFAILMILMLLERSRAPRGGFLIDEDPYDSYDDENDEFFEDEPDTSEAQEPLLIGQGTQTPEVMRRAQLYVPGRRFVPQKEEFFPEFEDVLPEEKNSMPPPAIGGTTQAFSPAYDYDAEETPDFQQPRQTDQRAAKPAPKAEATAAFVEYEFLSHAGAPVRAPKVITVRREPSVQPKQYATVKRIQQTVEKTEKTDE